MLIKIPGRDELNISHLVLDFNGTIAFDGKIIDGIQEKLNEIGKKLLIHVITADTNGTVAKECKNLPVKIHIIGKGDQVEEKRKFIANLTPKGAIAIGNGTNDELMFSEADLAIAIIGGEGCAISSLLKSDLAIYNINDALELLIKQHRLIATLRK